MNRLPLPLRLAAVLLLLGWALAIGLSSCTTIQKVFSKQTTKTDSTVIHRTDSLAYHQKTVKEGHQLSVRFDTGCTNTFTINPTTGLIQASGGVTGVVFTGTKEGKETDSVRLQGEHKTVMQKYNRDIHRQTIIKPKWWVKWLYFALGALSMLAWHHRRFVIKVVTKLIKPV